MGNREALLREFEMEFLQMSEGSRSPDYSMQWSKQGPVLRYVGEGSWSHHYSLSFTQDVASQKELQAIVPREKTLAKNSHPKHEWKKCEFPSLPAFAEVMEQYGYEVDRTCRLLFAPTNHPLPVEGQVTVRKIVETPDFVSLDDIMFAVWNQRMEIDLHHLQKSTEGPDPLTEVFLAEIEGEPISAAWIKYYHHIGFLFGGSTVKKYRGKGAYRALGFHDAGIALRYVEKP